MRAGRASRLDRRDVAALVLLTGLGLLLRLVALDANPSLEVFRGLLTDEGAWAHNARQAALFGRWVMDDHNPGLTIAPVYSAALRLGYALLGVDLFSTRLVAALSGVLLPLGVWAWVRRVAGRRTALLAGLLLTVGSFGLVHQRIATVEPLQTCLLLAAAAGVVHAAEGRRGARAAAAGAALALWLAIATKLTAVALAPAILAFALWRRAAHDEAAGRGLPPRTWGPTLAFATTAAAGLAVVAALAAAYPDVTTELVGNLRSARAPHQAESLRLHLPGLAALGLPYSGFLRLCAPLLAVVVLFAAARIAHRRRGPESAVEAFCWCWLVAVLGFVAVQAYQPDRRFLVALPPLAVLAALASRPGVLALPPREATSRTRLAVAGALLGAGIGAYAHLALGSGGRPDAAGPASRTLAAAVALGAAAGAALPGALPRRGVALPRPAVALLLAAIFAVDGARIVREAASLGWGVRDTSRALAALSDGWAPEDRVMVGAEAYTYALETQLFAFTVRPDRPAGIPMNPDGWARHRPRVALTYTPAQAREARAHGLLPWREFRPRHYVKDGEVVPSVIQVFVAPRLCPDCRREPAAAAGPPRAGAARARPPPLRSAGRSPR